MSSLSIELNRSGLHHISASDEFTASDSFSIELSNLGEAVHVHLHLDDDLSRVAHIETSNHYVEGETTRSVPVEVAPGRESVSGKLKVVTGYGNEQRYVQVRIDPPSTEKPRVDVDESLARPPQRPPPKPTVGDQLRAAAGDVPLSMLAVGGLALVLALAVALVVESAVVTLGVGVVIGVVLAATAFAVR